MTATFSCAWRDGKVTHEDFPLRDLDGLVADPRNLVWFDLHDPSHETVDDLARELSFDFHVVEDALDPGERPKVTRHDHHIFLQAYALSLAEPSGYASRVRHSRVSAFVVRNALITVRMGDGFDLAALVETWSRDPTLVGYGVGGLLHALLDQLVDTHYDVIQDLDDGMESLEDMLFDDDLQTSRISRLAYRLRRELVEVRRLTRPTREVVDAVIRYAREVGWDDGLRGYYEDILDHVLREAEWTESLRDLVSSVFETNLSLNDMRLNVVMKKLSAWAAIVAVPTLVTGWFGMNVPYPGYGVNAGMLAATGGIIVSVIVLFVLFRRHDWL